MGRAVASIIAGTLLAFAVSIAAYIHARDRQGPSLSGSQTAPTVSEEIAASGPEPAIAAAAAPMAAIEDQGQVVAAVAYEEPASPGMIRQTAGPIESTVDGFKEGVGKLTQALTPKPTVTPAPDPTSLATKTKPTPDLFLSMARLQEESGNTEAAEQYYQQSLRALPGHTGTLLAYAAFKDRQGQAQEALQWYKKAAKAHPNEASVHNDMGLFYARHGLNKEAMASYARAVELQPKKPLYRNNLAILLVDSGQTEQALEQLRAVYPEADACYNLGFLLQKKGAKDKAIDYFARAIAINPRMNKAIAWLNYLQGQPGKEVPQVARQFSAAGNGSGVQGRSLPGAPAESQAPAWSPKGGATYEGRAPSPRPSPSEPRPLPTPTADPGMLPSQGPAPGARPLPPVSGGWPAHRDEIHQDLRQIRPVQHQSDEEPVDAPLPTATPRPYTR